MVHLLDIGTQNVTLCMGGAWICPEQQEKRVQQESISGIFKADEPSPSLRLQNSAP